MESNFSVDTRDLDANPDPKHLAWYQAAVGCAMYSMIWTKPECCYCLNVLTLYMAKPGQRLLKQAKKCILYMKRAHALGVRFTRHDGKQHGINTLSTYMDLPDTDCRITNRLTDWFVSFFNSAPASFRSMLQRLAMLSSCESELVQLSMSLQEVMHIQEMLECLGFKQGPTLIFEDNQATIRIAESLGSSRSKTKHLG
eukprot:3049011-Rhodomonas_salina.2